MSMKNSNETVGKRTRDLPTCTALPRPTALDMPHSYCYVYVFLLLNMLRSRYSVSLRCSVYCVCVNVYCTIVLQIHTLTDNALDGI